MRCEHCGRNEATFHYQTTVNGHTEEAHLCPACAAELGYSTDFGGGFGSMLGDTFGSVFSLLPSMFGGFGDFFGEPQLTPAARRTLQMVPAPDEPVYETESLLSDAEGAALRRERERNALNVRLQEAVESEDYERAAQLRDELKKLDEN
ncbi:MAG: UvrB/UvrC motif-containing protein [Oscillospiraceae bacterium]|nr:UvrB/UvrC motif-containing protein [Oscillospiraceae bacterium]